MGIPGTNRVVLTTLTGAIVIMAIAIGCFAGLAGMSRSAHAARLAFDLHGADEGLSNLGGSTMAEVGDGYFLVASEHGVYAFDGRAFANLGAAQHIPDSGVVLDIVSTTDRRVAVRFPDGLFVSDSAISADSPPSHLRFSQVNLGPETVFDDRARQIVDTDAGLVVISGQTLMLVHHVMPNNVMTAFPLFYDRHEQVLLEHPEALFYVSDHLWVATEDGRVCRADPGSVNCYPIFEGRPKTPIADMAAGPSGSILIRTPNLLITLDPAGGRTTADQIPDQGGLYESYPRALGLYPLPNGQIATQSAHGLVIRDHAHWISFETSDGIPVGIITDVISRNGQLWIQVRGRGLFSSSGFGHWQSLQHSDGLSDGVTWQATTGANGAVWITTDTALDEVKQQDGKLEVVRSVGGASFAIARGPAGDIWATDGSSGTEILDPISASVRHLPVPQLNAATAGIGRRMWLATEHGLFHVDVPTGPSDHYQIGRDDGPQKVEALLQDGQGGVWFIASGRLYHRRPEGAIVRVEGQWPSGEFQPTSLAQHRPNEILVGGAGGLFRMTIVQDRVISLTSFPASHIGAGPVEALAFDERGWLWVGSSQGVAVFDGKRWVFADTRSGLVWNDMSQGGIYSDPDGSMWFMTSEGVSHLLDPDWLFADHVVQVGVSSAYIGSKLLTAGERLAFTTSFLALQFGVLSQSSDKAVIFRYRLTGVDDGWTETSSGTVRYPRIPPGRHTLTVSGFDPLTGATSQPASLTFTIAFPWYETWYAIAAYAAAFALALAALLRFWGSHVERAQAARRHELELLVAQRTEAMEIAQAELHHLATHDELTGLLNRSAIQKRIDEKLTTSSRPGEWLIAMLDLDHFKKINDTHGHLVGDDVIRGFGARVAAVLRDGEFAGRYGGEEILLLLNDTDGQAASRILVFHNLCRHAPFYSDDRTIPVTCSVGIAWAGPCDTWKSLIGRADTALYNAKSAGRDRIVENNYWQPAAFAPDAPRSVEGKR